MAIQGSYSINYTDPKNGSFIIEPYTVNGNVTPTSDVLHSKATRANTSLQLPGQYVPNYGELVHEDLVHLLENFSGDTAPNVPIEGQLWYDTGDSYDIIDLSVAGCTVSGNQSTAFSGFISNETSLTAWYGPVSTTNNSYNSIAFKVATVMVTAENNTVLTITALDGTALTLPNTSVGGFITQTASSRLGRLKVAVKVNNTLMWSDVVNIKCSMVAPAPEYLQNGDLWYDLSASQLKIHLDGAWTSLTGGYLPLVGGTMTGNLIMGTHPITFSGVVSTATTLTNKSYVDAAITAAITPLQGDTDASFGLLEDRVDAIETDLPDRVSKAGDNVRGALTFGPNGTTSTLTRGLDMKDNPIISPSITWSPGDYLTAIGETHNVVDKNYVALALNQHLTDAIHGAREFIIEQVDGSGMITDPLYFADLGDTLSFKVNGTSYGLGVSSSSLVVTTGSLLGSKIVFKQTGAPSSLFELGDDAARSYLSMYLFDGQPQPTFSGIVTAENEDTKVATKGYVIDSIEENNAVTAPVTSSTFSYSEATGPYNLTLVKAGGANIVVDINHNHKSDKIDHDYEQLTEANWQGGTVDLVGSSIGFPASTTSDRMLSALNKYKAPISGAKFLDFPVVGLSDEVVELDDSNSSFQLATVDHLAMVPGLEITMAWQDTEIDIDTGLPVPITITANYTITGTITIPGGVDPDTYFFTTSPALPLAHNLVVHPMVCRIPEMYDGTDVRALLNKASIDALVTDYVPDYVTTAMSGYVPGYVAAQIAADRYQAVVTSTSTALTLALTHANQYLRMNNAAPIALTVPPAASVAWVANTEIEVRNAGAGKVTLTAGAGVTLNPPFSKTLVMQGLGATVRLKYVSTNTWDIIGDTEAV